MRREKTQLRSYVHMSTGNYNEITSRIYTDFGILTCREDIAFEATEVFNSVGADVFNGLLNYAADLKLRARSVQARRAELTADPFKKEAKMVASLLGEDKVDAFLEHRRNGLSKEEAVNQIMA